MTFNVVYKPTGELVLEAAERRRRELAARSTLTERQRRLDLVIHGARVMRSVRAA